MKKILLIILILFSQNAFASKQINFDDLDYEAEIVEIINEKPVYLDLSECLFLSLFHNAYFKSRKSLYESKIFEYKHSITSFLPDAGLMGYTRFIKGQLLVGGALIEDLNEVALYGGFYIKHDLTNAGRNIFEMLSKKNLKTAQFYDYKGTKQQLLYETAKTYYELILAKLIVHNLLIALKDRTYQYEIAEAMYEVGDVEKLDVLRTESEVRQTKVELYDAVNNFQIKQTKLSRLLGIDTYSPIFPIEKEIREYNLVGDLTREDVIDYAFSNFPKIKEYEEEIKSLKKQRLKLFSDIMPNVDLDFEGSYQGTARLGLLPNTTFMINATLPFGEKLYLGTITKIKTLDKQIESKEYALKYYKTEVKENILVSFFHSENSKKKIVENKKKAELTHQSAEIATGKYFEGEEELINVIHSQTNKIQTMISLSTNKIDYNINQLSILYYGGLITIDNILKDYNP